MPHSHLKASRSVLNTSDLTPAHLGERVDGGEDDLDLREEGEAVPAARPRDREERPGRGHDLRQRGEGRQGKCAPKKFGCRMRLGNEKTWFVANCV